MEDQATSKGQATAGSELRIPATPVSRGVGIGRVVFLNGNKDQSDETHVAHSQIDSEVERLLFAVRHSISELTDLAAQGKFGSPESASDIFGVHLLILEGSSFIPEIESAIRNTQKNAEWAVRSVAETFVERQRSVPDQHLSEKYLDVQDVAERILSSLVVGSTSEKNESGSVFVVNELMPSRLMELIKSKPTAVISEHGGWTSHTSILARELKLPVVTGIRNIQRMVAQGDQIIVDGLDGQVIVNPTRATLDQFSAISFQRNKRPDTEADHDRNVGTLDGQEIIIRANADLPAAYQAAERAGASGIGLYRSEVIFNKFHGFPSEAEQAEAYEQIATVVGDAGVKIRTFDVGVDQLQGDACVLEKNPSLGMKSIRLSLTNSEYFRTQIRAILRASYKNKIDIVLPMISGVSDILRLREIIENERIELQTTNAPIGSPGLGAMIEIPSAVVTANEIARHVDFLCLGTNDLVQYMLAVDRDNEAVATWYETLHPAVIRAIRDVISAAANASIPVTVCGEIAGSAFYVPLLIGLGARELSMNLISISQVRTLILGITLSSAIQLVESIGHCETAEHTESILREYYLKNWAHLFPQGILSSKYF